MNIQELPAQLIALIEQIDIEIAQKYDLCRVEFNRLFLKRKLTGIEKGKIILFYSIVCKAENYDDSPAQWNDFKKAGKLIYEAGGDSAMHDPTIWNFVPKTVERSIDMAWDGIGQWRG